MDSFVTFQEAFAMDIEDEEEEEEGQSSPVKAQVMQRDLLDLDPLNNPSDVTTAVQDYRSPWPWRSQNNDNGRAGAVLRE
ncbi:hypothetical protein Forpe1208_v001798 [Fusarium oxysporum f. sp. rapae]|uniref:Uncharacterized protein n=1 Tax=Fusarium oxysporum f. sp. rapae TaxID=485398 RepID=A0A8J5PLK3_FUSOX|nr:hypothetical protein Forpe1208_v001798 [Fusarium oxysporum f. sp. rapae]